MTSIPDPQPAQRPWLAAYAGLTWAALAAHALVFALDAPLTSPWVVPFVAALHLVYSTAFAAVALAPAAAMASFVSWRRRRTGLAPSSAVGASVAALAVAGTSAMHLLVFADAFVERRWGFHLNGMVWDLVTTPGGVESLGAGRSTYVSVALVVLGFSGVQGGLLWCARRWNPGARARAVVAASPRKLAALACAVLVPTALAAGLSEAATWRPLTVACDAYPLFPHFRLTSLARTLGLDAPAAADGELAPSGFASALAYPLQPLRRVPDAPAPNVVMLVCESLRADMLTPEIMPATHAFAAGGRRFDRHYSAGNGTQMGVFGLFYGLTGPYWEPFLDAARGPVLFDVMRDAGYDLEAFTSARFTYPQFDHTVFARFPRDRLHERDPDLSGWKNDRAQVGNLLASIDRVPKGTPFFRFEFFESPHAPYLFPPKDVVRADYTADLDYVAMDLSDPREVARIFNRYVNACHHLDTQLARVFDGLRERGLLDSTIVVVAGDHGEEFMEHGHWGHHSAVTDAQTRTPFVMRGPGVPAGVEAAMTSHLDLAPTLLRLLGVANPPSDFCLGTDLIEGERRTRTEISGFDDVAVVDGRAKVVYGFRGPGSLKERATTADDRPAEDDPAIRALRAERIGPLLLDSRRFLR